MSWTLIVKTFDSVSILLRGAMAEAQPPLTIVFQPIGYRWVGKKGRLSRPKDGVLLHARVLP